MDPTFKAQLELSIDRQIAAAAVHRQIWYLSGESRKRLNDTLGYALSVRGDATLKRFEDMSTAAIPQDDLDRIITALKEATTKLIDNAATVADQQTVKTNATSTL